MKEQPTIGFGRITTSLRNRFNPLNNINPQRLGEAIDAYRHGYIASLARICEELSSRDDTWAIAAEKYKASVARCDWDTHPLEGYEKDPAALKQAEALRRVYASLTATHALSGDIKGGVRRLIKQMLDARAIGWSVHEITVSYIGNEPHLTLTQAPLWWFEATKGRLRYLPTDYGYTGEALLPNRWLIHGGAGIGIACAIAAIFKRLSVEDWLIWSERFGQPGIHGVTSAVPDSPEWDQAVEALRAYSADWQVLTGEGVKFEPIAAGNAGAIPYPKLVERMDRAIAALWRGADLSTLSAGTGEGSGASLQGDEADMIEQDACAEITETLHATLDRLIIDLLFGHGTPLLATFTLTPVTRPDVQREIAIDTHLVGLGAKLSLRDALARYGRIEIDPTDEDDRPLHPQGLLDPAPTHPQIPWHGDAEQRRLANLAAPDTNQLISKVRSDSVGAMSTSAGQPLAALAAALQADLSPAAEAVQELLRDPSPETARALIDRLPDLLPDDPEMAAILEETLADTFGDTLMESGELGVESGDADNSALRITNYALANSDCRAKDPEECRVHGNPKEKSHARQQIGKSGDWETLGLPAGRDIPGDKPEDPIDKNDAIQIIKAGDSVTNPFGERLIIDEVTYRHINKKGRSYEEVLKRLATYPQMKAAVSHPHEIWEDERGNRKYVQFLELNGHTVFNVVEVEHNRILSWHSNPRSYDHYREGILRYVRDE